MTDAEIIKNLGGATVVAKLLGLKTPDGARRVHNWIKRGIPAQIRLDHARVFKQKHAQTQSGRAVAAIDSAVQRAA